MKVSQYYTEKLSKFWGNRSLRKNIMHSNYQMIAKKSHNVEEVAAFIKARQKI